MIVGSKEFYEVVSQFEKDLRSMDWLTNDLRKESRELNHNGVFYCNGEVNRAFKAYLMGYSNAKHNYQL